MYNLHLLPIYSYQSFHLSHRRLSHHHRLPPHRLPSHRHYDQHCFLVVHRPLETRPLGKHH